MDRLIELGRGTFLILTTIALILSGCDDPNRPQAVMEVRIVPDSIHVAKGEAAWIHSIARSRDGTELPEWPSEAEWSIGPASVAEITEVDEDGRARVHALDVGTAETTAAIARRSGHGWVHVHPPGLASLEIEPSPFVTSVGMSAQARVRLLDSDGNELAPSGFRISWQVADTTVARVPPRPVGAHAIMPVSGRDAQKQSVLRVIVNGQTIGAPLIVIREPVPPAPPEAEASDPTRVELSWDIVNQASDGYRLERSSTGDGPFTQIASPGEGEGANFTEFVDEGLEPSTTYFYRLRSCNQAGCSEPSSPVSVTTPDQDAG